MVARVEEEVEEDNVTVITEVDSVSEVYDNEMTLERPTSLPL